MKKLLLVGAKFSDIPFVLAAKKLGFFVVTTGNNRLDLAHSYANEFHLADYSDVEMIKALCLRLDIKYIFPSCDDVSYMTTVAVANDLGLGFYDDLSIAKTIHHKDKFRALQRELGLNHPHFSIISSASSDAKIDNALDSFESSFILLKPTFSHTGRGISKFSTTKRESIKLELAKMLKTSTHVVMEEYIISSNHGFTTIISDAEVKFYFCDDEGHQFYDYSVSNTNSTIATPKVIIDDLLSQTRAIAKALKLKDGILHLQYLSNANKPIIIEATRRCGGDLYARFVSLSTGVDYALMAMAYTFNLREFYPRFMRVSSTTSDANILPTSNITPIIRACLMSRSVGAYSAIDFSSLDDYLIDYLLFHPSGMVDDIHTFKAGIIFLRFSDFDTLNRINNNLYSHIKFIR